MAPMTAPRAAKEAAALASASLERERWERMVGFFLVGAGGGNEGRG